MKKVDKRDERKRAAEEEAAKKRKEREEKEAKQNEQVEFFAEFHTDWRCEQEFGHVEEPAECVYPYGMRRRNFLARALEARHELDEIIIEPHENQRYGHFEYHKYDLIKVQIEEGTFNKLKDEARQLGVTLEEYVRGIFYTTAYKKHQNKIQKEIWTKEAEYKNRTPIVHGIMPADIRQRLEDVYGNPEIKGGRFNSYFDELMQLARDYFNY